MALNELAVIPVEKFGVLVPGSEEAELLRINLGSEAIGPGDLDRVRVPSGGSTFWTVASAEGEVAEKQLEGVILHVGHTRAYWRDPVPSGDEPDCKADGDCTIGEGDPGGECELCPFNKFGSAVKDTGEAGRGKACREYALVFLLVPGAMLPMQVVVSPGSLKAFKLYRLRLKRPYYEMITRLTLKKESNKDGTDYAQVQAQCVAMLSPEAKQAVLGYRRMMGPTFGRATIDVKDVMPGPGPAAGREPGDDAIDVG